MSPLHQRRYTRLSTILRGPEPRYPKTMELPHLTMPVSERDHRQGPVTAAVTLSEAGRVSSLMQTYLTSSKRSSDLTDDVLVQQAHIGDHGAFEVLVNRYSALLLRLICCLVQDEHLAQDVLQHVFLQLYRSLPTLVPGETLKAWLIKVARHRSIDELRRRRHLLFSEIVPVPDGGEFSPLLLLPDPDLQPEEQLEQDELRELLLEAIEMLPSRYRAVVLLRYAHHLSFREIGQELGIPDATAKTYFHRARKPLRALLEPEFAHERGMEKQ